MSHRTTTCAVAVGLAVLLCMWGASSSTQAQGRHVEPPAVADPSTSPASPRALESTTTGLLQGAVKDVDPGAGTLQVSLGPLGVLRRTLEVTRDTVIQVEGRQASLSDIREGETVRASYEVHETKTVATRIDVVPVLPSGKSR